MAKTTKQGFEMVGIVDAEEVPNWTRRPQKYKEIIDAIENLPLGKSVMFRFPDKKSAAQARNTIRDYLNLQVAEAIHEGKQSHLPGMVTTRIAEDDKGNGVIAYFTMSSSDDVIQAPERQSTSPQRKNQQTTKRRQ